MGPDALAAFQFTPLQSGGGSEWSSLFVTVLAAAFMMGLALIILFNRWNRPDLDAEHAVYILTQLETLGGTRGPSVVVRSLEALDDPDIISDIRGMFHGESPSEPTASAASKDAFREIAREVRVELHARAPPVSKVPVRAVQEAVLTALFGAITILPIAWWRNAARSGGASVPSGGDILGFTTGVLTGGVDIITAFPYTDVLFAFGLSFGIIGAEAIWTTWFVPPVVLIALAVTYWWLERKVETDRDLTGPPVSGWARRFGVLFILTWFTGTTLATIGPALPFQPLTGVILAITLTGVYVYLTRDPVPDHEPVTDGGEEPEEPEDAGDDPLAPPTEWVSDDGEETDDTGGRGAELADRVRSELGTVPDHFRGVNWKRTTFLAFLALATIHQALAFLAALTVAGVTVTHWTRRTLYRWRASARTDGRNALALDVVHSLTVTAAALTLPLLMGYAIAAFGTGKALQVAGIILTAPPSTLYAVLILGVVTALAAVIILADRFTDVRRGIRRAMSVQAVRSVVFARALPGVLMVMTGILALAVGVGAVPAVAVAIAMGLIGRFAVMGYNYITFYAHTREVRDGSASRVVISGRKVEDADGEPVYIADVNGHRTAHRRLDPLIKQIRADVRSLFREGSTESGTFARYYYVNGVRRGKVDMDAVADELVGDVRTRFIANVKQTDADASEILGKLRSEYPSDAVSRVVKDLKDRGRVTRREDRFQWLG